MILMSFGAVRSRSTLAGIAIAWLPLGGCLDKPNDVSQSEQAVGTPSVNQVPLDPTTIPQFVTQLPIPRVYAPTVITDSTGHVIRHEYTVSARLATVQMLPPGFPATTALAYSGNVKIAGSTATEFVSTVPGPVFDNTRGIPALVHWQNQLTGPSFMPVDPTLAWANPAAIEPPVGPFQKFPTVNLGGQSPIAIVTHNHGLVVVPQNDGIADEWFTAGSQRGPGFFTQDYTEPNEQPSTQLFYHDHVMGMTRLNVYAGLNGPAYFIRDLNNPLDKASSTLPRGEFEIPLSIASKSFFTDGEMNFPRSSPNIKNAYWSPGDNSDTNIVNGVVWPNLNVKRQQYRFRIVATANSTVFHIVLNQQPPIQGGSPHAIPFTLIGTDGGYLPQAQTLTQVALATTERADILVDFSQFAPGTQIIMNDDGAQPQKTLGVIMQFTVLNTPAVTPPPTPTLVARATLPTNAPDRIKTLHIHFDSDGDQVRSVDGLNFTAPPTEYPLIGSTEKWQFVNLGGGSHFIHIHLLEFQVVQRQQLDTAGYLRQWHLMNGHMPVTRPIVVDPTPFLQGSPTPAGAYDSGWKDTAKANPDEVLTLVTRWAPQETPTGGVSPGQNQYPIQPVDPNTNAWYLWHCHVLGHEDNDMMRKMPMVGLWAANKAYTPGTVVALQNIDYRVRVAHTSTSSQPPNTRFDLWERVNNNDGTWQPQIIYAVKDRVLFNGQLYRALTVHQAQTGQSPNLDPAQWEVFPMNACAQIDKLCANGTKPDQKNCLSIGNANDTSQCQGSLEDCLAQCDDAVATPCSGLCNNPTSFTVPDGTTFNSGALGTGAACFETTSEIVTGSCTGFGTGRQLTINGKVEPCTGANWATPLTGQRHFGYCIQTTAGTGSSASFQVH
jgi:FtsP/CotA-like multicopper oxidase with cupredoxin domain